MVSSNAEVIRRQAGPSRIGLCGTRDWIATTIRKVQVRGITRQSCGTAMLPPASNSSHGVHGKNIAPQDIYECAPARYTHSLTHDLGTFRLRRLTQRANAALVTPVEEFF